MAVAASIDVKVQKFIQLASNDLRFKAVYLFGSSAKGKAHRWSDIDLAIVSSDFCGDSFEDSKRLFPFILEVDTAIEVHPFRPADFSTSNPFVKEIIGTGIRVL